MAATKLVLTAIRQDETEEFLSSRVVSGDEVLNLYAEAKQALDRRVVADYENERRMVRNTRPRTQSVRADLKIGDELVDRDMAYR
jgi:hypothetical protein